MKTTNKQRKAMPRITFIAIATIIALFALTGCPDPDPEHTHEWGAWTVTTPATCTAEGVETRTCTLDPAHIETRAIAIDPDAHDYQWRTTTAPTCTTAGEETEVCSHNSSHTKDTRAIAIDLINGHDWDDDDWTETIAPTCTTEGEETTTCTHEHSHTTTRPKAINPNAHDYQWITIAPSFIEKGVDKEICSRCSNGNGNTRNMISALPITRTQDWSDAMTQLDGKTGRYTLTINGDFGVAGSTDTTFGTTEDEDWSDGNYPSLEVTLKGNGKMYLTSRGNMIRLGENQTLIIDSEDLTLQGLENGQDGATANNDNATLHIASYSARLELQNGTISGNNSGDTFFAGGGVHVFDGTFIMNGGTISGNTGSSGGGVYMSNGIFTMNGGTISSNIGIATGGGVIVSNGTFTMKGGIISGNTANTGGGVSVGLGTFHIVTGTVYGSNESDTSLRNTATNNGAALYKLTTNGTTAERGTFSSTDGAWVSAGDIITSGSYTDDTINVVNGVIVP